MSVFMTCFGTAHELSTLPQKMREWDKVKCFMLANETATTTGRPHVHILVKFHSRVYGTAIWKAIGMNCDLRPIKHWGKSINYLKKQDPSPISHNMAEAPKPGKRTDLMLDEIKEAIIKGATPAQICDINLEYALKYPNGLKYLQSVYTPLRDPNIKPEVRCYIGLAGSGKTYNARTEVNQIFFQKSPTNKWWDGYAGDPTVICDEVTAGCAPFHELLTYLDYGSPRIEIKGTMVPLRATKFIFTSNHSISSWYTSARLDLNALYRRIDVVRVYYAKGGVYEELRNPDSADGSAMRNLVEASWEKHFPGFVDRQSQEASI